MGKRLFSYVLRPGEAVYVQKLDHEPGAHLTVCTAHGISGATIKPDDGAVVADGLSRAILEGCGMGGTQKPSAEDKTVGDPIILERPVLAGDSTIMKGFRVSATRGDVWVESEGRGTDPAQARILAAVIAARADEAEALAAEPDPADVKALGHVIREGIGAAQYDRDILARAILRAGYRPPERAS
jgi:hypothetical protein